jgi:hypothetical protein
MVKIALCFLCICLTGCSFITCDNSIVKEVTSPDGEYVATAFIRDCGATTSFSPQVYLRKKGEKVGEKGNVFIGNHSESINVEWLSSQELRISSDCEVVRKEDSFGDIKISVQYVKEGCTK